MYQKNNPWLSLVALLIMALIIVLNLTGCTEASAEATEPEPPNRYTYEIERHGGDLSFCTITDTQTGHQYLFARGNNKGGLCKLED